MEQSADARSVKQYNKMTSADFAKSIPAVDWNAYAKSSGLPLDAELVVGQPSFSNANVKNLRKYGH